ncbi:calcium:proton antiporter [Pseudomonas luteola]
MSVERTSSTSSTAVFTLQNLKQEKLIIGAAFFAIVAYLLEHAMLSGGRGVATLATFTLIGVIICAAIRVAHHAEVLAEKVGDPYGTMILTTAAVLVEVIILAVMMMHTPSPTLARDTIYAAIMLDMNMIMGLAALLGGLKHGEQVYNDNSGRSYTIMIMAAVAISMVLPNYVPGDQWKIYSAFTIGSMALLYALFLRMQTKEHSYFFSYNYDRQKKRQAKVELTEVAEEEESTVFSVVMLVAGIVLTGLLAEVMSKTMNVGLEGSSIPPIFAGIVVALISASPEILTALRSALDGKMQPVINVAFGATLATVILTVPVIEVIALIYGHDVNMALTPVQLTMVGVTLVISALNISDGESNAIEGGVHFVLFLAFIMLSLMGL